MTDLPVDAHDCAREPIHLSGAIQPHGYLVSCSLPDWTVRQASANVADLFGVEAAALVGQDLREFVADEVLVPVADMVGLLEPGESPQRVAAANIGIMAQHCDVGVHVAQGLVHLEFECGGQGMRNVLPTVLAQSMVAYVNNARDMGDFFQRCAYQVQRFTGYDRVMVYRFRHDEAGEVIAEACTSALEPYNGLRFPASDIPPQARALYVRNRIRVIPDAAYASVPVVPGVLDDDQQLDLSQHALRSVSPVHLEYLRNMGGQASMSLSIVVDGRLWGLFACHHAQPRTVSPATRAALDMFSMFVSMRVSSHEQEEEARVQAQTHGVREALAARLGQLGDIGCALRQAMPMVAKAVPSDGVALRCEGKWALHGYTPDPDGVERALRWAQAHARRRITATPLGADWGQPAGAAFAGVLAVPVGRGDDWLLFFRREQREDVTWAGDPHKPMVPTDDGVRIAPRRSFAGWKETVRDSAVPWSRGDQRAAELLYRLLKERPWQPLPEAEANVSDMDAFRRRHALADQKQRLDQLSALLGGLAHLGDEQTLRIGEGIAALEAELQRLLRARPAGRD